METNRIVGQNRYTYAASGEKKSYRLYVCDVAVPSDNDFVAAVDSAYQSTPSILRQSLEYGYDNQGRIVRVTDGISGSVTAYAYTNKGTLSSKTSLVLARDESDNLTETEISRQEYEYILAGLVETIRYYTQGTLTKTETYNYYLNGNLYHKISGNKTLEYAYDDMGRLTGETEKDIGTVVRQDTYHYDIQGNRSWKFSLTSEGDFRTGYAYDNDNTLTGEIRDKRENGVYTTTETVAYTYDESGNQLSETVNGVLAESYVYDDMNRLSAVTKYTLKSLPDLVNPGGMTLQQVQSQTVAFAYDGNAQRVSKTISITGYQDGETVTSTASVRHYINEKSVVYDRVTQSDMPTKGNSYLFGSQSADGFAQFEALWDGSALYAAVVDGHTDVTGLIKTDGSTIGYEYDAFGNEQSIMQAAVYNPFRYTSQYYDAETGLYYLRARYYDPTMGRFTQKDSYLGEVRNPETLNLYLYACNNPLMNLDHFGQMNYLTQTGKLFSGIGAGLISGIKDMFDIFAFVDMAKAIFSGQLNLKSIFAGLLDNSYVYVIKNLNVLNPFSKVSDTQVYEMGKRLGGIVLDIAMSLIGVGAAKVLSVLKTTKIGQKLSSTLCKVKSSTLGKITGSTYCFTEGTPVLTDDGQKPIEEVQEGDMVWSANPETGEQELKPVEDTFVNETDKLVHVTFGGETVTTTPEHPFYVPQKGWTLATDLHAGDRLQLVNGEYVVVEQIEHELLEAPIKVYNFEVRDNHTYYVGSQQVLVHNACSGAFAKLSQASQYGIDSYSKLRSKIKGKGLEAHHILEQRLGEGLGKNTNQLLSVALTKAEHQNFTNLWRKAIPYGTNYSKLSKNFIWSKAQEIYKEYPELLEAAKKSIF